MWKRKTFRTRAAMERFMAQHPNNQYEEIIVHNGYGLWFKRLLIIGRGLAMRIYLAHPDNRIEACESATIGG